ncbi:sterol desaturase family protein [Pseudomonas fluorescens]|uniref:sterol desaturase family protein n=1 Tax=Pseudomonas fluorescens TaxID=294 RepID=UPI001F0853B3|nr:sterol desaturase family protein [Pseudomonas fluorescens]
MKRIFSRLYAPLFWVGFIGGGIGLAGYSLLWLLPLFVLALTVSFAGEWLLPYEVNWNRPIGDRRRDMLHALVNEALNTVGLLALPGLVALLATDGAWPSNWPLWLQVALAIFIADAGVSLMHYASHRVPWMWRLHAIHHSVERLYGFNGLMKHPLHQLLEATAGLLPLLVLGIPSEVAVLLAFAIAIQLLLQHSNVDMRVGPLRWIFAWAPQAGSGDGFVLDQHSHRAVRGKNQLVGIVGVGRSAPRHPVDQAMVVPQPEAACPRGVRLHQKPLFFNT